MPDIPTHCMPFGYLCLHLVYMMLNIEPKFEEFYVIMVVLGRFLFSRFSKYNFPKRTVSHISRYKQIEHKKASLYLLCTVQLERQIHSNAFS